MWSVGRKRGRLYLGSRVALLQVTGQALVMLEHPPTLPLSAVLQQLTLKSQQQGIDLRQAAFDVDLGASLCKGVVVPTSFNAYDAATLSPEMRQKLAQQLPWPADQWAWASGCAATGLLPMTTQGLMRNLLAWGDAQKIKLGFVQALWLLVTQSERARSDAIHGVVLTEPDGTVVFTESGAAQNNTEQANWHYSSHIETVGGTQRLHQLMSAHQLKDSTTVVFEFRSIADSGDEAGLRAWSGHWVAV
ncbi:MAG: hypothetical protein ACKVOO_08080 [Burkholderiaceae bacterium]